MARVENADLKTRLKDFIISERGVTLREGHRGRSEEGRASLSLRQADVNAQRTPLGSIARNTYILL